MSSFLFHQDLRRHFAPFVDLDLDDGVLTKYSSGEFLLSIGPETDNVLDRFRLSDSLIPQLRVLAQTVRSSRWESVLHSREWGLSMEQAANISTALLLDIQPHYPRVVAPVKNQVR